MKIELGMKVRDRVTGYSGVAVSRRKITSGVDQIGIQPPMKADGTIENGYDFDECQIEVVDASQVVTPLEPIKIECDFGDLATDKITGYKGRVTAIVLFLNGCAKVGIRAAFKEKDEFLKDVKFFDYTDLEFEKKKEVKAEPKRKTGGPMSKRDYA